MDRADQFITDYTVNLNLDVTRHSDNFTILQYLIGKAGGRLMLDNTGEVAVPEVFIKHLRFPLHDFFAQNHWQDVFGSLVKVNEVNLLELFGNRTAYLKFSGESKVPPQTFGSLMRWLQPTAATSREDRLSSHITLYPRDQPLAMRYTHRNTSIGFATALEYLDR